MPAAPAEYRQFSPAAASSLRPAPLSGYPVDFTFPVCAHGPRLSLLVDDPPGVSGDPLPRTGYSASGQSVLVQRGPVVQISVYFPVRPWPDGDHAFVYGLGPARSCEYYV